jgi:hypothetical protein
MRRFLRRKSAQTEPPDREPELPCIVEAVQKLAAEMDGAQDILGKLKQACEDEERQKGASPPAVPPPPVEPKPPAFRVGQHVMVTGLHTATEHNGKVGKIESFRCEAQSARGLLRSLARVIRGVGCCCSAARGRWVVRFEDSTTVALRGERVRHVPPTVPPSCTSVYPH